MEPESSLPHSQELATRPSFKGSAQAQGYRECLVKL